MCKLLAFGIKTYMGAVFTIPKWIQMVGFLWFIVGCPTSCSIIVGEMNIHNLTPAMLMFTRVKGVDPSAYQSQNFSRFNPSDLKKP